MRQDQREFIKSSVTIFATSISEMHALKLVIQQNLFLDRKETFQESLNTSSQTGQAKSLTDYERCLPIEAEMIIYLVRSDTDLVKPGPPQEARQPKLGPWLDFERQKTLAAVAVCQWSGHHYIVLACQKSTVTALKATRKSMAYSEFTLSIPLVSITLLPMFL